jgi:hypothetical protein
LALFWAFLILITSFLSFSATDSSLGLGVLGDGDENGQRTRKAKDAYLTGMLDVLTNRIVRGRDRRLDVLALMRN